MFAKNNLVFVTVPDCFDVLNVKCILIIWQVTVDCVSLTLHSFPAPCVSLNPGTSTGFDS